MFHDGVDMTEVRQPLDGFTLIDGLRLQDLVEELNVYSRAKALGLIVEDQEMVYLLREIDEYEVEVEGE